MSLLEQLARKRLEKSKDPSNIAQSQSTSKSASLLERLHKNREAKSINGESRRKDLKSLLAKDRITKNDNTSNQHTFTLSSKLSALRKPYNNLDTEAKPAPSKSTEGQSPVQRRSSDVNRDIKDPWNVLNEINYYFSLKEHERIKQTDGFAFTEFVSNNRSKESKTFSSSLSIKKHYNELFTVFQPSTVPKTTHDNALKNFNKPSPDDIIQSAQLNAFNEKLVNLSIESKSKADKKELIELQTPPIESIDVNSFIANHSLNLTCLFLGDTNSGKSTLVGHILYELHEISMASIRDLKKNVDNFDPTTSNHFKIIVDNTKIERESGSSMFKKTIQIENSLLPSSSSLTLIDTPGDARFFNKETINSILTFNPDVFTLVIDCNYDSWEKLLDGPTNKIYEILRIISYLNMNSTYKKRLIILLNKADSIGWDKQRLEMIQSELLYMLTETFQWETTQFQFIPCSGLSGSNLNSANNVVTKSKYKSEFDSINDVPEWYEGPTFLSHLYSLMEANMNKIETTLDEPFTGIVLHNSVLPLSTENNGISFKIFIKSGYIQTGQTIEIHTPYGEKTYYGIITQMIKPKMTLRPDIKNRSPVGVHSDILEIYVKIHPTDEFAKKQIHIYKSDLIISPRKANTLSPNLPNSLKLLNLRSMKLSIQTCAFSDPIVLDSELILYHDLTYTTIKLVKIVGTNASSINPNQSLTIEVEIIAPGCALNVINSKYVTNDVVITSTDYKTVAVGKIACQ
ncbi:Ski7p [Saccharomyces eubayanus]|uniref:Ski7p n=1 Tax=Saccharomyces eubayanus TaxID=1080349 RepID=UPI0006C33401|nr:SKI7-like protein [Saccharomyces eubayanus]KOG96583.1 SKI7-like protein [Saccharomyces eubayanus]